GIYEAVNKNVLIYIHKEKELEDVEHRFPADHYILIDDKIRILTDVKKIWGDRVTTVFPKQGHYALDPKIVNAYPPADITISRIGELLNYDEKSFLG
ncbi:MAG TPA: HAD family hydrolase, partial [Candidatus Angelobacter sp.]|nr:HAD family hydrolase [Candidatus Angelobacter sp.]